jgi:DNA polymerase-2
VNCTAKVFILTGEWADRDGQLSVTYYGRSPKLGPVEITFENVKSCFLIPRSAEIPELNCKFERKIVDLKSFTGAAVDALYFSSHQDARTCSDRIRQAGVQVFEADIKPHERFLMEHFIHGQMAVQGEAQKQGKLVKFVNPKIRPCEVNTNFRIASIDIECGVESDRLYSIACDMSGAGEDKDICFMLGDARETRLGNLEIYPSEQSVLNAFMEWFQEEDPDIIIGWHVIGFDLMYLERKCDSFYMDLNISRNSRKPFLNSPPAGGHYATISGRIVLDGPPCMRDNGYKFENFSLETVSQSLIGEGKIIKTAKEDKIAEIEDFFENDKDMLGKYNIQDCVLVTKVFNHVDMIRLMTSRVKTSGLLLPSIGISNLVLDHLYLPRLHRLGYCAPAPSDGARQPGGTDSEVMFNPGIYDNVCHFSLKNIIPSLISSFRIDPLAKAANAEGESISSPGLMQFSRDTHVLPGWLDEISKVLSGEESFFSKATSVTLRQVLDAMKSPTNRFYSFDLTAALEESIAWILNVCKEYLESEGYVLCSASTKNLYIQMKPQDASTARDQGALLASRVSRFISEKAAQDYKVELKISVTCEEYLSSIVIPAKVGHSKEVVEDIRYAATIEGETRLCGLKISGADWTKVTGIFQKGLYETLFSEESLDEWMKNFVGELKDGQYNDHLIYTKKLLKKVDEYTGNVPPHVKAARMLEKPGKVVKYMMSTRGPVPAEHNPNDIDFQHYIDKQLGPIADTYLSLKGQKFENLFKAQQLSLFDF